jgi:hypothetical protein
MAKPNLRLVAPITENRTVTPQRAPNADLRTREHLTADEVEKLIEAAKANRHGYRDALMVLLAYRHGLPAGRSGGPALGAGRLRRATRPWRRCGSRNSFEINLSDPPPIRSNDALSGQALESSEIPILKAFCLVAPSLRLSVLAM